MKKIIIIIGLIIATVLGMVFIKAFIPEDAANYPDINTSAYYECRDDFDQPNGNPGNTDYPGNAWAVFDSNICQISSNRIVAQSSGGCIAEYGTTYDANMGDPTTASPDFCAEFMYVLTGDFTECNFYLTEPDDNSPNGRFVMLEMGNDGVIDVKNSTTSYATDTVAKDGVPVGVKIWVYMSNSTWDLQTYASSDGSIRYTGVGMAFQTAESTANDVILHLNDGSGTECSIDNLSIYNMTGAGVCRGPDYSANTAPGVVLTSPDDNKALGTNLSVVFTPSDNEADPVSCTLNVNNSVTPVTNNSVDLGVATTITVTDMNTQGYYAWNIACEDGTETTTTTNRTYILDTEVPTITIETDTTPNTNNNSYFTTLNRDNISINVTFADSLGLYRILLNITNGSDFTMHSNYTENFNGTQHNINITVNISTWSDGNYTIELSANDDISASPYIEDKLKKGKKGETEFIFNESENKKLEIKAYFVEKDDKPTDTPGDVVSFIEWNEEGTELEFGMNFTVVKPETKVIFNLTSPVEIIDRTNNHEDRVAHFNWADYFTNFQDAKTVRVNGEEQNAVITYEKISDYEYLVKIEGETQWQSGDFIEIDPVTAGIHTTTETILFGIDSTPPVVTLVGGTANDSAYYSQDWIYVNISWNEAGFKNISYDLDDSVFQEYSTQTSFHNFTSLTLTNHTINVTLCDVAHQCNSTETRTNIVLDTILPNITAAINKTADLGSEDHDIFYPDKDAHINATINDTNTDTVTASHNATGTWVNYTVTNVSVQTYSYTIPSASLTAGTTVGWIYYINDSAGNLYDLSYEFIVTPRAVIEEENSAQEDKGGAGAAPSTTQQVTPQTTAPVTITPNEQLDKLLEKTQAEKIIEFVFDLGEKVSPTYPFIGWMFILAAGWLLAGVLDTSGEIRDKYFDYKAKNLFRGKKK